MEASVVMPVIIIAVITIILIVMFFYSQMTERSKLHMELRKQAGKVTGKTEYLFDTGYDAENSGEIFIEKKLSGGKVYGKKYIIMTHKGILGKKGVFTINGTCHAVDSVQYVRFYNLVKDIRNE